jgi:hypothetical protein
VNASTVELARALDAHTPYAILNAVRPREVVAIRERLEREALDGVDATAPWDYAPAPRLDDAQVDALDALIAAAALEPRLRDAARAGLSDERRARDAVAVADDTGFTAWSAERYGLPDAQSLDAALRLLAQPAPNPEPAVLSGARLAELIGDAVGRFGIDGWTTVVEDGRPARMSVRSHEQVIVVDGTARFGDAEARRLIAHEVGGHVLRTHNARRQPHPLAAVALGDATATEEGLAATVESLLGVQRPHDLRNYALRTVAVHRGAELGVLPLVRELAGFALLPTAVEVAVRVKRGLRDPNLPGGFTKDHHYFSGLRCISTLVAGDNALLRPLFATRWSVELLDATVELAACDELDFDSVRLPGSALLG